MQFTLVALSLVTANHLLVYATDPSDCKADTGPSGLSACVLLNTLNINGQFA